MPGHLEKRYKSSWTIIIDNGRDIVTGKRVRITKNVKGTKKEAEREMLRILQELDKGTYVEPSALTLGEYLKKWLKDYGSANLAPTTLENYTYIVDAHLTPNLGDIMLSKLQPVHLQEYYTRALEEGRRDGKGGLSARSVRYHHTILREALSHAVKWQIVARNVADAVEPPKPKRPEIHYLSPEQIQVFLRKTSSHPLYTLFYTALFTGMRKSELLGMRWQDVNLEKKIIYVRQSLHRLRKKGYVAKSPKTKKGQRGISISVSLVEVLQAMRRSGDLVFCKSDGTPLDPSEVYHQLKAAATKAGFPEITFHDLRHSHATLLLAQGVHPKVVQERLGHESIMVTLDIYSHVVPGLQEAAAAKIDKLIGLLKNDGQRFGNDEIK